MKQTMVWSALAFSAAATTATAGGFDLTGHSVQDFFQPGRYLSFSINRTSGDIEGTYAGVPTGNVSQGITTADLSFKDDINDQWSYGIHIGRPYAASLLYPGNFATGQLLGGTSADLDVDAVTVAVRYKFTERWSVYAGPRYYKGSGTLNSPIVFPGGDVVFENDSGWGFLAGVAYEIPEYFVRVSLTFSSNASLDFDTTQNGASLGDGQTPTEIPQTIDLAAQAPVSRKTLLLGSIRWAEWSGTEIDPGGLTGDLLNFDDTVTYSLGVAHRFTDKFTAVAALRYEDGDGVAATSPYSIADGSTGIGLAGIYSPTEKVSIRLSAAYAQLGDRSGVIGPFPVDFSGNDAWSFGLKVGYHF